MKKGLTGVRIVGLLFLLGCFGCQQKSAKSPPTPIAVPSAVETVDPEMLEVHPTPTKQTLSLVEKDDSIRIELPWEGGTLHRGYSDLRATPRASKKELKVVGSSATDTTVPNDVELHYLARSPAGEVAVASIRRAAKALPKLSSPSLLVDKTNYTLEILDLGQVKKRYPIALGQNPVNRKYCQDMASTPEGWYKIYNLQPDATYHKALDVDYPRPIDYVRHSLAIENQTIEPERPIGGEIQIHGWGINSDWTAGCMALRDKDMDEIFADVAIRAGMEVFIAGSQLRPEDKSWLRNPPTDAVRKVQAKLAEAGLYQGAIDGQLGDGTALALGKYQVANKLPDSCQLDGPTRAHFGL